MLPYRQFSVTPGARTFGHEYTGGELVKTVAYFSLVDASLVDGADEACKAVAPYSLSLVQDTCVPPTTEYDLVRGVRPSTYIYGYPAGLPPPSGDAHFPARAFGGGPFMTEHQADLFSQGIFFETGFYKPGDPNAEGEKVESYIVPSHVKVYYFNPMVNSFSHYALRTSEQVEFVIAGLGFDQDDAEIDQGGLPYASWKSYVTEIEFWHQEGGAPGDWEDNFEDGVRDLAWNDEPNSGTIEQAGGLLTLAIEDGHDGMFWGATENGPVAWINVPGLSKLTVETKLNSYPVNDRTYAGIYITDAISGTKGIHFARAKYDPWGRDGLRIMDMGVGEVAFVNDITFPTWLKVEIEGSGAGSSMVFKYSTNGTDWTTLYTRYNETWSKIGLLAFNTGSFYAVSAPFEYFKFNWDAVESIKLPAGDFTLDSDAQITIPKNKFPFLSMGTYKLKIRKTEVDELTPDVAEGYAGVWRPDETGLCTAGAALILRVGLMPEIRARSGIDALPLVCFTWKNKLGGTYEDCVAPIDTRSPETFYDGRIIDVSSVTRAIDHRTGLFQISDMTIRLVNTDKKYSKLLANWFLKNQAINLWLATGFEPESDKTPIVGMIVEDYHLQGTQFVVKLKDITQKYFKKKVPPRICTELIFPQIHPDEVGKAFPEVLGQCILGTEFENPGAVQAIYTDTLVYEYLAANGILYFVSNVFSDGEPKSPPADYSIVWRDGRTFIDFTADQEDKKITFNARGYSVAGLNSVNGHIQNPAYIILYYLRNILEVPDELLNTTSFDVLASKFDDLGVGESGKLIIQTSQDSMEVLRQLFFSYGIHGFPANDGRFVIEKKDIFNYATETFLFDQIDLMDSPLREFNLTEAINTVKATWDYIPWQRLFKDAREDYKDNKFEADMEDDVRIPRDRRDRRRGR